MATKELDDRHPAAVGSVTGRPGSRSVLLHPRIIRISHWLNAIAILIMIGSGWRIYNNFPIIPGFSFPETYTLGGDPAQAYKIAHDGGFGNATLWHFAGMWLLVLNGLVYLAYGLGSGRLRRKLFPIRPREVVRETLGALRFRLDHSDLTTYNAVQRLLYVGVILTVALAVLSGLAIWKPVQLQALAALFGSFQGARIVHFICMCLITSFLVIHVALTILVPRTLLAMITGRTRAPAPAPQPTRPGA